MRSDEMRYPSLFCVLFPFFRSVDIDEIGVGGRDTLWLDIALHNTT